MRDSFRIRNYVQFKWNLDFERWNRSRGCILWASVGTLNSPRRNRNTRYCSTRKFLIVSCGLGFATKGHFVIQWTSYKEYRNSSLPMFWPQVCVVSYLLSPTWKEHVSDNWPKTSNRTTRATLGFAHRWNFNERPEKLIALFDDSNSRSVCCGANSKVFIRMH